MKRPLILIPALALALAACGASQTYPTAGGGPTSAPDYAGTRVVAEYQAEAQAQAEQTKSAATQAAIANSNTARELSAKETQLANDTVKIASAATATAQQIAIAQGQATDAAAIKTQDAYYLPAQMTATAEWQQHEQDAKDAGAVFGAVVVALVVVGGFFTFFFAIIDRLAAHNRAMIARAMSESTKVLQIGQMVVIVAGGKVVDTYATEPGAQVVEHEPQLPPPARDERTQRALQFLEVAIACAKSSPNWPPNRVPTHIMLKDFHARDFYSGSSWQQAVNLFGGLIQGTPGKGAFVQAPTLEEFYQQLASNQIALPQ